MWSRTLRLKITGRDGVEKFDARIPVRTNCSCPKSNICLLVLGSVTKSDSRKSLSVSELNLNQHSLCWDTHVQLLQ
jgi:hypothetical protein